MKDLLKIYNLLGKQFKKKIPVFIFLTLVSTIFEILSIGLIVPLISTLLDNKISFLNLENKSFYFFLILLMIVYFVKTFYLIFFNRWQFNLIFNINYNLSNRLFYKYIHFDYNDYLKKNSSELVRNVINVENFSQNIYQSVILVSEIILIFSFALILLIFQPIITLFTIIFGFVLSYIFLKIFNPKLIKSGEDYQNKSKTLIQKINQSINNFKDIKIYQRQEFFLNQFKISTKIYSDAIKNNEFLKTLPRIIIELIAVFIVLIIIFVMLKLEVQKEEIITFVALFAAIGFRLIPSLNKIIAAIQHLKYYLKLTDNISDDLNFLNKNLTVDKDVKFNNKITLKNLSFAYSNKNFVLKDFNMRINKNEITGIKGRTGSGKSTIVNLITGLLQPQKGDILIDDIKVNLNNSKWFNKIGYVPQRIMLNEDSIRNNIIFGAEIDESIQNKLDNVLKYSQLKSFVDEKGGLDLNIGELGKNISGGQIQRIGIARALFNDPEILILDESTSNLDKITEEAFIDSIKSISKNKTVIIISHDEKPLEICDNVYDLDKI